jgi:hypothetical protein
MSLKASEPPVPITEHRKDLPPGIPALLETMLATEPAKRPTATDARKALMAAV